MTLDFDITSLYRSLCLSLVCIHLLVAFGSQTLSYLWFFSVTCYPLHLSYRYSTCPSHSRSCIRCAWCLSLTLFVSIFSSTKLSLSFALYRMDVQSFQTYLCTSVVDLSIFYCIVCLSPPCCTLPLVQTSLPSVVFSLT